ncbi:unnamed protein product [Arctia plantaginis]|uniref:Uncharacterized protein n=1 Tax=Arctia plantaginis TaxID=874455 RepID=A0A8S1BJY0_ARCPL|nr:unnamed protein product [Arctia plantaginis]
MSFRRNRPLINDRVKRMLQMVEDTIITNRTKKKYVDADQESNEDFSPDVSEYAPSPGPNILESPLSSASSLSADSACINKIIAFPEIISTPSTISNLSLYLTNADFVASSSEIYIGTLDLSQPSIEKENQSRPNIIRTIISQEDIDDTLKSHETSEINHYETLTGRTSNDCSHAKQVVTDNEDSPSLIRKISSEEENNETLRPEGQSESDNDTTLTGRTSNDCSHAKEVVTDGEDSPSLIRKISSEEENNETVRPEGQSQSDNDITMDCGTLSNCSHTATAESEKKRTRKRKLIRTEWRTRRRGRKRTSTQDAAVYMDNVQLQRAYHQRIPISKALHTDLLNLCSSGAIPQSYHYFYQSLSCSEGGNENISEEELN